MPKTLQHRRGTTSELSSVTGAAGEIFYDTTKDTLVVMDGSTAGGYPLEKEGAGTGATGPQGAAGAAGATGPQGASGVSAGGGNLSAVAEDILPNLDAVYDLGSSTNQWYDLFVSNGVTIDGGLLTGNATGLVTDTVLIGDLLVTGNTITPDASTALQYNGNQGVVDILGNLDASSGDWLLPPVVQTVSNTPPLTTGTEGALRYNNDVGALQLYTDSWKSIDIKRVEIITNDNYNTFKTSIEPNKRYFIWNLESFSNIGGGINDIKLPVTGLTAGDIIEITAISFNGFVASTVGGGQLIKYFTDEFTLFTSNYVNMGRDILSNLYGKLFASYIFVWDGTYWLYGENLR